MAGDLMAHKHDPVKFSDRQQLLDAARNAVTDLQAIENDASFTTAERDAAIKKVAQIERHLIRAFVAGV